MPYNPRNLLLLLLNREALVKATEEAYRGMAKLAMDAELSSTLLPFYALCRFVLCDKGLLGFGILSEKRHRLNRAELYICSLS